MKRYAEGGLVDGYDVGSPGIGGPLINYTTPISPVEINFPNDPQMLHDRYGLSKYEEFPGYVDYNPVPPQTTWEVEIAKAQDMRDKAITEYNNWQNAYGHWGSTPQYGKPDAGVWNAINQSRNEAHRLITDYNNYLNRIGERGADITGFNPIDLNQQLENKYVWDQNQVAARYMGFAEGGPVPEQAGFSNGAINFSEEDMQEIYNTVVMALNGEIENAEEIIERFIQIFGEEELNNLISSLSSGGGGAVSGPGGPTDDAIPALINGSTPARLSSGEYVLPADVVAGIGNGSTELGNNRLGQLINNVRGDYGA